MRLGAYDINPGILIAIVIVIVALTVFISLRIKSGKTADALIALAQAQGWTWFGSAPQELRDALDRIYTRRHWSPTKVMEVPSANGNIFLFHFESRTGFEETASNQKGIACLVTGRTRPNAPVYSVGQFPPGAMRLLASRKVDLVKGIGSPAFRERFYVVSPGYVGNPDEAQTELEEVQVAPALESELLTWNGHTASGLPDGWSSIVIRDQLAMVAWNSRDDLSESVWCALLTKGEAVSRVLHGR